MSPTYDPPAKGRQAHVPRPNEPDRIREGWGSRTDIPVGAESIAHQALVEADYLTQRNGGSPMSFLGHLEWLNVLHVELWLSSVVVLQSPEPTQVAFTSTNQVPIRGTYTAHTPTRPLGEGIVGDWLVGLGQRERALALIGKLEPGNVIVLSPVPLSPIARSNPAPLLAGTWWSGQRGYLATRDAP